MQGWDFENTTLVILGAGFSFAASGGGTPLMKGYFDRLSRERYPDLYDFVLQVGCSNTCPTISDANVERVLLTLEQARTATPYVLDGWFDQWIPRLESLRRQLAQYTLSRLSDGVDVDSDNWAVQLLGMTGFNTTYVSLNYDCIAEVVLAHRVGTVHCYGANCPHCKMRQLLNHSCSCGTVNYELGDLWHGSVIKLHGSIAWSRCITKDCCLCECIEANCDFTPYGDEICPQCGKPCVPVMVFPTMSKNLGEIPQIGTMWQACRAAVEQAESILIFGFSLPTSDELLAQLMRRACERKKVLKRVGVIDLDPDAVIHRFKEAVNPSGSVEYIGMQVKPNEFPAWYVPSTRPLFALKKQAS